MIAPCGLGPDGGEEPELTDAHRQVVVLRLEAERAGHAAASGVDLDDLGARDAAEQGRGRGGTRERLLVAVAVEQHAAAADRVLPREDEPAVGEASRSSSSGSRVAAATAGSRVVREQGQVLVAQGQQARRLHADDGHAAGAASASRPAMAAAIRRAWSSSPFDRLARPQHPASSNRTCQPASSRSSMAARPADGSVKVVKESARKISSPWDAGPAALTWPALAAAGTSGAGPGGGTGGAAGRR